MIEAERIILPVQAADFGRHKTGKDQHSKPKQYCYVPILKQLERILNFKDVLSEINEVKTIKPKEYSYFESGEIFKTNSFFQTNLNGLQILLYIDDASTTADKGNRSKKNKLCFVYCSLGNLKRKDRSTFIAINLVAIFRNTTVKQFGLNVLLRPLINDLKKLEEGVLMNILGIDRTVRGTLSAVIADNLGSHQIGCFKVGFSKGFRKCRFCLAVDDDIQSYFRDKQFIARDKIQHDQHCDGLSLEAIKEHVENYTG